MTKKKIKEGNKIIAEFMNYDKYAVGLFSVEGFLNKGKYHISWDWLMPVVHKCCKEMSDSGVDKRGSWSPQYGYPSVIYTMQLNNSIESVWNAVIRYIIRKNKK